MNRRTARVLVAAMVVWLIHGSHVSIDAGWSGVVVTIDSTPTCDTHTPARFQ